MLHQGPGQSQRQLTGHTSQLYGFWKQGEYNAIAELFHTHSRLSMFCLLSPRLKYLSREDRIQVKQFKTNRTFWVFLHVNPFCCHSLWLWFLTVLKVLMDNIHSNNSSWSQLTPKLRGSKQTRQLETAFILKSAWCQQLLFLERTRFKI